MQRRQFLKRATESAAGVAVARTAFGQARHDAPRRPNVVVLLCDEWRAQALGYAGDRNAKTPTLDALAAESVNCVNTISGLPLCCPGRGCLMTGQYPLKHGVFINDVPLEPNALTLGQAFKGAGYRTGYVGKWHLHGSPDGHYGRRGTYIPADKHFGFDYWKASECDHDYNHERFFVGDDPAINFWPGYSPLAETDDACAFIADAAGKPEPFFALVSLGPPHFPYGTAPDSFRAMFHEADLELRPNVPKADEANARRDLHGYYSHGAALDTCAKKLLATVDATGAREDTIFVFMSDHGDMLWSQGLEHKLFCWDESLRVPLLIRYPRKLGRAGKTVAQPMNLPDVMPTLLGVAGIPVPAGLQGIDFSRTVFGKLQADAPRSTFINNPASTLQLRAHGIDAYRGVRTERYTYVRAIEGPWLLYDNQTDPYQMHNLIGKPAAKAVQPMLEAELQMWLTRLDDKFLPGDVYLKQAGLDHYFEAKTPIGSYSSPWGDWTSTYPKA